VTAILDETVLQDRLKDAMRARAADQILVLRGIIAALKNLKIERRGAAAGEPPTLSAADITQLVRREIKQREEAIGFAEKAARADLVEKNAREKEFLESFLPQGLSKADLDAAIARLHAAGATAIGPLMGKLKAEFGARLDGKAASEAIKEYLSHKEGS
jgi:uncharacterized protein YqeY